MCDATWGSLLRSSMVICAVACGMSPSPTRFFSSSSRVGLCSLACDLFATASSCDSSGPDSVLPLSSVCMCPPVGLCPLGLSETVAIPHSRLCSLCVSVLAELRVVSSSLRTRLPVSIHLCAGRAFCASGPDIIDLMMSMDLDALSPSCAIHSNPPPWHC